MPQSGLYCKSSHGVPQGFSKIVGAACSRDLTGHHRPPSRVKPAPTAHKVV